MRSSKRHAATFYYGMRPRIPTGNITDVRKEAEQLFYESQRTQD